MTSLDFELFWGVRDHRTLENYRANLLGVREAIPALLQLFAEFGIHATWATVGFLFFENRDELLAHLPEPQPAYEDARLNPYGSLGRELGADEEGDPYHFGASLLEQIARTPNQEIGSHTFSHLYCLEAGQDAASFRADLTAALEAGQRRGVRLRSLVFPRNQVNRSYLPICRELGFVAYRGNPPSRLFRERRTGSESALRRGLRLLDAYVPISGDNSYTRPAASALPVNIPASRFLRAYKPIAAPFEGLRLRRILSDLERAARTGRVYHLWFHPHNFGTHLRQNVRFMRSILEHFAKLRSQYGIESLSMGELAGKLD